MRQNAYIQPIRHFEILQIFVQLTDVEIIKNIFLKTKEMLYLLRIYYLRL